MNNVKPPVVEQIPLEQIEVVNPRVRNMRVFKEIVDNIAQIGLKRPITVARRNQAGPPRYDLVCGQGRLEAFRALKQTTIPAMVIPANSEDCMVMSLVENLARRHHAPLELMRTIGALRTQGYTTAEIATKTDFSLEYIDAICHLLDHGEARLLTAVEQGVIPATIALEIVRAKDSDVQEALTEAYKRKQLPGNQMLAIRRIVEQRRVHGKTLGHRGVREQASDKKRVTADSLVRAYRRKADRQRLLVKKATVSQSRLLFVVNALRRLLADEQFVTLLRAEKMLTLPRPLAERLGMEAV
jgi:ParB family chromosome partitioning protein